MRKLFLDYYPSKTENSLDHTIIYKAVSLILVWINDKKKQYFRIG